MINEIVVNSSGILGLGDREIRSALGKGGVSGDKHEGDGSTPLGTFPLRKVFYRSDRVEKPETVLPTEVIKEDLGWCDDPEDEHYNELVTLPYKGSHEKLSRTDHIYDIVVVLGYNDDPVISGKGSAVFLHLTRENYTPTDGCVAVSLPDMFLILKSVSKDTVLRIIL